MNRIAQMMQRRLMFPAVVLAIFLIATGALAAPVDTVNWSPDATIDGTGAGTLDSGAIGVVYSTVNGVGNAGTTISDNWDASLATDGASGSGVTHSTAGILGASTGSQVETITFNSVVSSLVLFANFTDSTASLDFGSHTPSLLDSNNAQLAANIITFTGSTNSFNDGFAATIPGTFGPGNPLQFTMTTTAGFDSIGFTVAAVPAPEPTSLVLFGLGALGLLAAAARRTRRA